MSNPKERVVIIGHTVGVRRVIESLVDSNFEVVAIFTHPRADHEYDLQLFAEHADRFGDYAYDVFDTPNSFGIPVLERDELSSEEAIKYVSNYSPTYIVTVGCRSILTRTFIDTFPHVLNLHPFHLPYFRGAGIDSWMILSGKRGTQQRSTAHFVTPRIDAGNIIAQETYLIPDDAKPIDIFKVRINTLGTLARNALETLQQNSTFEGTEQDELQSRYFPRLLTARDGRIDFTWNVTEIHLFVQAFSYPYPGSFFEYDGRRITAFDSERIQDNSTHPLSYGLLLRKGPDELIFSVPGGLIRLFDLRLEDEGHFKSIKLGRRVTPASTAG